MPRTHIGTGTEIGDRSKTDFTKFSVVAFEGGRSVEQNMFPMWPGIVCQVESRSGHQRGVKLPLVQASTPVIDSALIGGTARVNGKGPALQLYGMSGTPDAQLLAVDPDHLVANEVCLALGAGKPLLRL